MHRDYLQQIETVINRGPFQATWDSLEKYQVPDWYQDAKFGIFIHWGVYAVPAFDNEWYPRHMYLPGTPAYEHHRQTYGPQDQFGYKDFIPQFTAGLFDPEAWAELFAAAGARYVVPVAEHHDGFQMYASHLSHWNAAEMGPRRDITGELAAAVRGRGLNFGVSSHRAEHWWFMGGGRLFPSDVQDPAFADFYGPAVNDLTGYENRENYLANPPDEPFLKDWLVRTCELIDRFQPRVLWFDWWIMNLAFKPWLKKMAAYYYNRAAEWGVGVAINYKNDAFPAGTAVFDVERGQLSGTRGLFWQTDTAVARNSWCHVANMVYKEPDEIISDLADIVAKNGALLLNIGPRADGTIPEEDQLILRAIGRWLSTNGEAIYETRPWLYSGEGPTAVAEGAFTDDKKRTFTARDIRFTQKGPALYAIVLAWPADGRICISRLAAGKLTGRDAIAVVSLLGEAQALSWQQTESGLEVDLAGLAVRNEPFVLKIN